MIATDPLSLVFLACFVFSGTFLVLSTVLGVGHGHALHLGGHAVGHTPHALHGGHAGHPAHAAHTSAAQTASAEVAASPLESLRTMLDNGLNLYSILTLLLIFGLLGYLLHNVAHVGDVLTLLVSVAFGAGSGLAIGGLMSRVLSAGGGGELTADSSRMEGRLGKVSMAIRPDGVGEVIFTGNNGARQSAGARSYGGEAIPEGTEVVILSAQGGIVTVQPWDAFMVSVRAGDSPALEAIE
ncbi:MAG TPA: NfeD family protein [Ktedonobacterales bacterium]|nr:NfeD family protein [Ktedonobacterales bacterium]